MESRENKEMTLEEAEKFYKTYAGNTFHMYRDETGLYKIFASLNIPADVLRKWDQEIIETLFNKIWGKKEDVIYYSWRLFDAIRRDEINLEKNILLFLKKMEKCVALDYKHRIIILEFFAGGTDSLEDGYCYFICKRTPYKELMNEVVTKLMDFTCADDKEQEKYRLMAVEKYKKAYKKFGK